ncbi:MAG: 30S ribosomal protein S12 methylthiotransferase RimO [Candidatus Eisenbacteria bacterium]
MSESEARSGGRNIAVVTLGCPKNLADSESMLGQLHRAGFRAVSDPAEAELIVVNTCAFLTASQQESIETILEMSKLKEEGELKKLVVAGCLAQRHGQNLLEELPEVDYLIGTGAISQVVEVADGLLHESLARGARLEGLDQVGFDWEPRVLSEHRHTAYLKISEGCNNTCTFCIIPTLRGKHRSRPIEELVAEARRLAGFGVKELTIIAQDTTSYGLDLYGRFSLHRLLEALEEIDGIEWVRLLYTYPRYFGDELVDCFGRLEKLRLYVDMPIQHAADSVLRRMKRGLGWSGTEALLHRLKGIEGMVLRTTVITGFPGETEEEFRFLLDFLGHFEFDHLGAFAYSTEEGTPAGALPDQLPEELRAERRDLVLKQQRAIALRRNRRRIGRTLQVLIDRVDREKGIAFGRWSGQAIEIDGEVKVMVPAERGVRGHGPDLVPGTLTDVRIRGAGPYDLVGVLPEAREKGARDDAMEEGGGACAEISSIPSSPRSGGLAAGLGSPHRTAGTSQRQLRQQPQSTGSTDAVGGRRGSRLAQLPPGTSLTLLSQTPTEGSSFVIATRRRAHPARPSRADAPERARAGGASRTGGRGARRRARWRERRRSSQPLP